MTIVIGTGLAWLVTAYRLSRPPASRRLPVCSPSPFRPTSLPTPIWTSCTRWDRRRRPCGGCSDTRDPEISACRTCDRWRGASGVLGFVLYPYVYLPTRALFAMQSASLIETGRTLGLTRASDVRPDCAAAGAAGDCRRPQPRAHGGVERYRRLRVPGHPHADGLDLFDVGHTLGSAGCGADRARHADASSLRLVLLERWARRHQRYANDAQHPRPIVPARLAGGRWQPRPRHVLLPSPSVS